jgi:hypothetical protein
MDEDGLVWIDDEPKSGEAWEQGPIILSLADVAAGDTRDGYNVTYATESPAEFFAVCSETFFERPTHLRAAYPEVYGQLQAFYRQDPAARLPDAG